MDAADKVKEAFSRNMRALGLRSGVGRGTAVTKVRATGGLRCEVEDGKWKHTVDASPSLGGESAGPDPGVFGRTALGSCIAQAYLLWAAHMDVPIDSLEVVIEADYDARGMHGLEGKPPVYEEVRYKVAIESAAPQADIDAMIEKAERHCPYLQTWLTPMNLRRVLTVNGEGS